MVKLSPRVTRIRAANASPMTLTGTNTYLIDGGGGKAAVIDPGPALPEHLDAIVAAASAAALAIEAIFVTHGHPDHAPGALPLHERTRAPVHAHPNADFPHDVAMMDNDAVRFPQVTMVARDAPGHKDDHLVFVLPEERALFTGDVVIGEGTVVIAPPHGDMRAYQATLAKLMREYGAFATIYGGHGPEITDVRGKLHEYIEHRQQRERQLLAALETGPQTVPDLVRAIYASVNPIVWPAAARQMVAYLTALEREGRVVEQLVAGEPSKEDADILNPDLSRLAKIGNLDDVAAQELGVHMGREPLKVYRLI